MWDMWGISLYDYELWQERDYEILIMWPISRNGPQFQIFTVLITIVSAEGRRKTGNYSGSPHCSRADRSVCAIIFDICFILARCVVIFRSRCLCDWSPLYWVCRFFPAVDWISLSHFKDGKCMSAWESNWTQQRWRCTLNISVMFLHSTVTCDKKDLMPDQVAVLVLLWEFTITQLSRFPSDSVDLCVYCRSSSRTQRSGPMV